MIRAIDVAREAGRKVAFTLSDIFCVDRHRDDFTGCSTSGRIDILFANQAEVEALAGVPHLGERGRGGRRTRSRRWSSRAARRARWRRAATSAPTSRPSRSRKLVDTTGAGDLFAAGFLAGEARGLGLEESLKLGAICAAEVIQHYGARPEADLRALAGDLLA